MVYFYNLLEHNLSSYDACLLVKILNDSWQTNTSVPQFRKRLVFGSPFLMAQAKAADCDKVYLQERFMIGVGKAVPVGLMETIALETGGSYDNIPRSYCEIAEAWSKGKVSGKEDTLLLVDVTLLKTRRGSGLGETFMKYALNQFRSIEQYKYLWTYTPNIEKVVEWHKSLGAEDSRYMIRDARVQFKEPDVRVMDYSGI